MIIRKPYAFLIKNFKKIHIFLLILSFFVAYKIYDCNKFINEFMKLGVYDLYKDPITNHISAFMLWSIFFLFAGSGAFIILLMHKKKPWKIYLIPFIEYLSLFLILNMIKSFFASFNSDVEVTDIRFARDMLMFFMIAQLPAIGVFIIRTFGLDIKKFNFNSDQEFLELSEEDREEIEISFSVDFNTIKRLYKRLIRNLNYFYIEHKIICKVAIAILVVIIVKNTYTFIFVTNRVYKAGQLYNANGYSIIIKNAYYTNKDYKGNVISNSSSFVLVEMYVKNNSSPRKLYLDNFHLKNKNNDYVSSHKMYADEFYDIGKTYESIMEMNRGEELNFYIVYKVDKKLPKNGFVMYYQELGYNNKLRKIKLNVKDISKVTNNKNELKVGEDLNINILGVEDTISIDKYEFVDKFYFKTSRCESTTCGFVEKLYTEDEKNKVLKLEFASLVYESKDMINLFEKHVKISYMDTLGEMKEYDAKFAVKGYYGKYIFLVVPNTIAESEKVNLLFSFRDKNYVYNLK